MEKITVQEFVNLYNTTDDVDKIELVKKYCDSDKKLSMIEMKTLCDRILDTSHVTPEGKVWMDSCKEHMIYTFTMLDAYTHISPVSVNFANEYNLLDMYGLVELILASLNQKERAKFDLVLDLCKRDFVENKCSLYSIVNNMMNAISAMEGALNK